VISDNTEKRFWELDADIWDTINNVGLRNHYFCSVYAARLMVPRGKGLILFVSSAGGLYYFFNVPYGVGKAAVTDFNCCVTSRLRSLWRALKPVVQNAHHCSSTYSLPHCFMWSLLNCSLWSFLNLTAPNHIILWSNRTLHATFRTLLIRFYVQLFA
jgi:hypothetical protein